MEPITSNAYKIFYAEVLKHLERARVIFFGDDSPTPEVIKEASTRFHTIRGGAGFFGLGAVTKVSAELETLLNSPTLELAKEIDGIKKRIVVLEGLQRDMPAPKNN